LGRATATAPPLGGQASLRRSIANSGGEGQGPHAAPLTPGGGAALKDGADARTAFANYKPIGVHLTGQPQPASTTPRCNVSAQQTKPAKALGHGYVDLYDKLMRQLSYHEVAATIAYAMLGVAALASIPNIIRYATDIRNQAAYPAMGYVWALLTGGMAVGLLILVVNAHRLKPEQSSTGLAAFLLTLAPTPRQRSHGLLATHIRHVQRLAEIEQAAADWRGQYAAIIIVTAAALILGAVPSIVAFLESSQAFERIGPPGILAEGESARQLLIIYTIFNWLLFAGSLWLIWRMFHDIRTLLTREAANRTILFACEEALALLSERWLDQAMWIDLDARRQLAEDVGYTLVQFDRIPVLKRSEVTWPTVCDDDGTRWALVTLQFAHTFTLPKQS
jgi:hypothetical protein